MTGNNADSDVLVLWIVAALFALLSVVLLSGHGANLIAGYNTASEKEKSRVDEKKLCRVVGGGMAVITVLLVVMALCGPSVLPPAVSTTVILLVCALILVLSNTVCKKK